MNKTIYTLGLAALITLATPLSNAQVQVNGQVKRQVTATNVISIAVGENVSTEMKIGSTTSTDVAGDSEVSVEVDNVFYRATGSNISNCIQIANGIVIVGCGQN